MNSETKLALIAFIDAVSEFAQRYPVVLSDEVIRTAEQLKKQLNSDETIL